MRRKEIGSFFESEDYYTLWFEKSKNKESFQTFLNKAYVNIPYYFESGRSALTAILSEIKPVENRKVCLLPSYTCDTVIIPFIKSDWQIEFYQINKLLEPDLNEIKELVNRYNPTLILLIPYFGTNTIASIQEYIKQWRTKQKGIVIEDFTQSLFLLNNCSNYSDYKMISLRKWFAVSSGAVSNLINCDLVFNDETESDYSKTQSTAQKLKTKYLNGMEIEKTSFLDLHRKAEELLDDRYKIYPMDYTSYSKLTVFDVSAMYIVRNQNSSFLNKEIKKLRSIRPIINMNPDAAPLYFPIFADKRDELQEFMKNKNVFLPVLWTVPKEVKGSISDDVSYIYDHMLAVPCDHRYGTEDMKRIINAFSEYEGVL